MVRLADLAYGEASPAILVDQRVDVLAFLCAWTAKYEHDRRRQPRHLNVSYRITLP